MGVVCRVKAGFVVHWWPGGWELDYDYYGE